MTQVTSKLSLPIENCTVMDRRSLALILIVLLLVWSVNQPSAACPLMNSRAAAMVRAGASPASQPEPSPSRHTCCPSPRGSSARIPPTGHCALRATPDMPCCSISSAPPVTSLLPEPAKAFLSEFVVTRTSDHYSINLKEISAVLIPSRPPRIEISPSPLLRL